MRNTYTDSNRYSRDPSSAFAFNWAAEPKPPSVDTAVLALDSRLWRRDTAGVGTDSIRVGEARDRGASLKRATTSLHRGCVTSSLLVFREVIFHIRYKNEMIIIIFLLFYFINVLCVLSHSTIC